MMVKTGRSVCEDMQVDRHTSGSKTCGSNPHIPVGNDLA